MTRVRRLAASVAIAGAVLVPFSFSTAQPAVAYCDPGPTSDGGGSGCTNNCKKINGALSKVHPALGELFLCLQ